MQRSIYIRPLGIFTPAPVPETPVAEEGAGELWGGLPLCGGPLAFCALEMAERTGKGVLRRTIGLGDLFERDWGRNTLAASDLLEAIRAPRPRLAGLSMDRPCIMGIVNVTPDSFSDGGSFGSVQAAIDHGLRLLDEGAGILDIGGESTRPGSDAVALDEELRRVMPVLEGLRARTEARISVDTRKVSARLLLRPQHDRGGPRARSARHIGGLDWRDVRGSLLAGMRHTRSTPRVAVRKSFGAS
jgi:dihydropteroate synthase